MDYRKHKNTISNCNASQQVSSMQNQSYNQYMNNEQQNQYINYQNNMQQQNNYSVDQNYVQNQQNLYQTQPIVDQMSNMAISSNVQNNYTNQFDSTISQNLNYVEQNTMPTVQTYQNYSTNTSYQNNQSFQNYNTPLQNTNYNQSQQSNFYNNYNQSYNTGMTDINSKPGNFNDNMPNPITEQKMVDEKYKGVLLNCSKISELPPSVQTECFYQDQGVSIPRYIRATHYTIPSTNKIAKSLKIPIGIVSQPFADFVKGDSKILSSYMGQNGPQRCEQCRGYVNPQCNFIDGGKTMVCNLCNHKTPISDAYFCYLDNNGVRLDKYTKPELCQGSYEMSTSYMYCRNNKLPKPPIYLFMFNVSRTSMMNGMLSVVADVLSEIIPKHLPYDDLYINTTENGTKNGDIQKIYMRVAFLAYDKRIYYFNVREHINNKQAVEICIELNDPYIPSFKGFVVDPYDCGLQIQSLLQELPKMFMSTNVVDTILGPVIESAISLLKSNGDCGKLIIFHSILPNYDVVGKLTNRDNSSFFCTENELSILKPQNNFYTKLASQCVENGISVNLFLTTSGYIDIATLSCLCDSTGGKLHYYPFFDAKRNAQQLGYDLKCFLLRVSGNDAFIKLRVSNGLRVKNIYGCLTSISVTDAQIAYIDSDTTIAIELEHDNDLKMNGPISCQLAILYTSISGQRRLRIHNISLNHSSDYSEIFRLLDTESLVCMLTKKYCTEILKQNNITYAADKLSEHTFGPILAYIKFCKQSQSHFQHLILPDSLKLYPLYMNAMIKSDAFLSRREIGQDGRSIAILRCKNMNFFENILEFYPAIFDLFDPLTNNTLEDLNDKTQSLTQLGILQYRCIYERLLKDKIYILVSNYSLFLWIGNQVDADKYRQLFGVNSIEQVDGLQMEILPAFDNDLSNTARLLFKLIRKHFHPYRFIPIMIVRQSGVSENVFRHFLCEGKSPKPKSFTYMEYLCHLHKSVMENL